MTVPNLKLKLSDPSATKKKASDFSELVASKRLGK
jgi:hypothetical protein